MTTFINSQILRKSLPTLLADAAALTFIYFIPAISHLLSFPLYLIEPMRLMLILAMVHTSQKNAYLLALSLPLFSLLISGHPSLPKMILISVELTLNVYLFFTLYHRLKNTLTAVFISIVASKIVYYLLKYILISMAIIQTDLFSTPFVFQLLTTVVFSLYMFQFFKKKSII